MLYRINKNWLLIAISVLVCILEVFVLLSKDTAVLADNVNELSFSHESGFYEEEFDLVISGAMEGTIYYTLDGSEPDKNSLQYEAPIHISDASGNENVYCIRTDVTTGFLSEEIDKYSPNAAPIPYTIPDYKVDKATVVRAVVYYNDIEHSEIKTASYFVNFSEKTGYENMNIISIVADPDNLFGYENGIYVTGASFDNYWSGRDGRELEGIDHEWIWWPANYRNRGLEWERAASCQFFDEEGDLYLSQTCGIRTHGGMSRGLFPRSLNLYARDIYDGNKQFLRPFFDTNYLASCVTLTQGGSDYNCKLSDYLFSKLTENLSFSTMDFKPYVMFLNGEYWGVYWLTEKYDEDYLSYHYGIYEDNVIMIKNQKVEEGIEGDADYRRFKDMYAKCTELDLTDSTNYERVCEMIDIESYIDYYAAMLYISRRGDWPSGNMALWRSRDKEVDNYADEKWRYMAFDLNAGCMTEDLIELDSIEAAMEQDAMFKNLMSSDIFCQRLISRIEELSQTVFASEHVNEEIDRFVALMAEPMKKDEKRFFGTDSQEAFYGQVESVRSFFEGREKSIGRILEKYK